MRLCEGERGTMKENTRRGDDDEDEGKEQGQHKRPIAIITPGDRTMCALEPVLKRTALKLA